MRPENVKIHSIALIGKSTVVCASENPDRWLKVRVVILRESASGSGNCIA